MDEAARRAGAPAGAINWMTTVTLEGTQELMKHRDVAVILATGGMGLVRAAYSAGKPAYGVGPGQRARVHRAHGRTSRRPCATSSPARRSTTACCARRRTRWSSTSRSPRTSKREFQAQGGYFMSKAEMDARRARAGHAAAAAEPGAGRQVGDRTSPDKCGITRPARHARADRAARGRRPRLSALDREAVPGAFLLRRQGLARGLRALQADPAVRRHGPHDVHPLAERAGHPRVRPARSRRSASSSTRRRRTDRSG